MVSKQKISITIIFLIMLIILTGACTAAPAQKDDFEDTPWVLEQYGEKNTLKSVLAGTKITATFESAEGQLHGSAGCNQYFGDYEVDNGQLSILSLANTEMACLDPEGVMEQERQYLQILHAAESYKLQDDKLIVYSGDSELVFITAEE